MKDSLETSTAVVGEVLSQLVTNLLRKLVSRSECLSIVENCQKTITEYLDEFQIMQNNRIHSKVIFNHEVEPVVGQKEEFSRYSVKYIELEIDTRASSKIIPKSAKPWIKIGKIPNKTAQKSFSIRAVRSVDKRSSVNNNIKSFHVTEKQKEPSEGKTRKMRIKTVVPRTELQYAPKKRKKSITPEPKVTILDKETRIPTSQFNFFYQKLTKRPVYVSSVSKDSILMQKMDTNAGMCSLEGESLIKGEPSFDAKLSIQHKANFFNTKSFLPSKKVFLGSKEKSLVTRDSVRLNVMKIHDKEKLKQLLSKFN